MANGFIPNIGDVATAREELAWPDKLHFDTLVAAKGLNGVLDGCGLSADGGGPLRVGVVAGCVVIDGVAKTVALQTVDIATGSGIGTARLDLITIDTSGVIQVEVGDVSAVPVYKAIPASRIVLGGVLVVDGQTTVVEGDINDMGIDLSRQPFVMNRQTALGQATNTTDETSVFTYTLPGRSIGTDGGVRVTLAGELIHAVSSPNLTLRMKLGATTIFATQAQSHATNADPRSWKLVFEFLNVASFSSQKCSALYRESAPDSSPFQFELTAATDSRHAQGYATSSEDTSADKVIDFTAEWTVPNALNSFKREMAIVERIPPA